jgi:hypothetical protein
VVRAVSEDSDLGIPNIKPRKAPTAQHGLAATAIVRPGYDNCEKVLQLLS